MGEAWSRCRGKRAGAGSGGCRLCRGREWVWAGFGWWLTSFLFSSLGREVDLLAISEVVVTFGLLSFAVKTLFLFADFPVDNLLA